MVTKRIRSEYMKKFKDPKWETFSKCYEEMLKYRLTRRLLEHSHNPWFWGESDTDSDSGGRSPTPAGKNRNNESPSRDRTEPELEECAAARINRERESDPPAVPRLVLSQEESIIQEVAGAEERECDGGRDINLVPVSQGKQEMTGPKTQLTCRQSRSQRVRPLPTQQVKEDVKQARHPFVLYASGEKDSDIARRKTHNVRPVASTKEIHESACVQRPGGM
ncbi:hypothetical protein WMY93_013581 [Mugilogobius chulae]|uniref:Centriole, cilia and spindle-associated protein n=1 Tax=Mugilogobius chulae TaxID=88201 RepID=A0AAW0NZW9_9GOBI